MRVSSSRLLSVSDFVTVGGGQGASFGTRLLFEAEFGRLCFLNTLIQHVAVRQDKPFYSKAFASDYRVKHQSDGSSNGRREEMANPHIATALTDFVPLSKLMAEQIQGLRSWSKGRARLPTSAVISGAKARKMAA
jgi:hypothetical protein